MQSSFQGENIERSKLISKISNNNRSNYSSVSQQDFLDFGLNERREDSETNCIVKDNSNLEKMSDNYSTRQNYSNDNSNEENDGVVLSNFGENIENHAVTQNTPKGPPDEGKYTALAIFLFLGVANLLPWNCFITAASYYRSRFCNTAYENTFESFFSMFYTVSQPIGLIFAILFKKRISTKSLVLYPLIIYAAVFCLTTILVAIPTVPPNTLFGITLVCTFCAGMTGAIMNGGLFGLSGILPDTYTGMMMTGNGLAGTTVSVVSIIILAASTKSTCNPIDDTNDDSFECNTGVVDYGALSYFLVALGVLIACIFLFRRLLQLPFVRYYMKLHLREQFLQGTQEENPLWTLSSQPQRNSEADLLSKLQYQIRNNKIEMNHENTVMDSRKSISDFMRADSRTQLTVSVMGVEVATPHSDEKNVQVTYEEILSILKRIYVPASAVFLVFMSTLAVFPSVMVLIKTYANCTGSRAFNDLWLPMLFVLFNLGDFIGRLSAPTVKRFSIITPRVVWFSAVGRITLSVFLCLGNIQNSRLPIVVNSDGLVMFLIFVLGITNGLVANLAMMFGPQLVEPSEASLTGTIMIFCLSAGLLCGACLSFVLIAIIVGTN